MGHYVRVINKSLWEDAIELSCIQGMALFDWSNPIDNDYSVYYVDDINENKKLDCIVLRQLASSFVRRSSCCDLLLIEENILKDLEIEKDALFMGAQHCNIKNVNYGLMQKMIEYTFENLEKNTRVYDLSRIGQIIQNLSVQDLQIFLENGQKYNKSNTSFKDTIKNKYFSGKKNKLWKLSD